MHPEIQDALHQTRLKNRGAFKTLLKKPLTDNLVRIFNAT